MESIDWNDIFTGILGLINLATVFYVLYSTNKHNENLLRMQFKQQRILDEIETWQELIVLAMRFNEYAESRPAYIEYVTKCFDYKSQMLLMPVDNVLQTTKVYAIAIENIMLLKKQLR